MIKYIHGRFSNKKIFVLLCFFLAILIVAYATIKNNHFITSTPEESTGGAIDAFEMEDKTAYLNSKQDTALIEEFRKINLTQKEISTKTFSDFYEKIGPQAILDVLEEDKYCHDKGHNLGRVVYQKTDDLNKSMQICGSRCSTGCFHGVLMGMFSKTSENDHVILNDVKNNITTICDQPTVMSKIQKGVCIHGVGHAITFLANYDIDKALDYCKLFKDQGLIYYCATGVYMERSIVYGVKDSKISNLYPCDESVFPAACYRYKLRFVFSASQHKESREFCQSLIDSRQKAGCFHGVGFRYYKEVYESPPLLEELCDTENSQDRKLCIEGAIGVIKEISRQRAFFICQNVSEKDQPTCNNAISVGNFGLNRNFTDYIN